MWSCSVPCFVSRLRHWQQMLLWREAESGRLEFVAASSKFSNEIITMMVATSSKLSGILLLGT